LLLYYCGLLYICSIKLITGLITHKKQIMKTVATFKSNPTIKGGRLVFQTIETKEVETAWSDVSIEGIKRTLHLNKVYRNGYYAAAQVIMERNDGLFVVYNPEYHFNNLPNVNTFTYFPEALKFCETNIGLIGIDHDCD